MTARTLGPLFLLFLSQGWAEEARILEAVSHKRMIDRAGTRRHEAAWAGAEQWSLEGEERGAQLHAFPRGQMVGR